MFITLKQDSDGTIEKKVIDVLCDWIKDGVDLSKGVYENRDELESDLALCLQYLTEKALDELGITSEEVEKAFEKANRDC